MYLHPKKKPFALWFQAPIPCMLLPKVSSSLPWTSPTNRATTESQEVSGAPREKKEEEKKERVAKLNHTFLSFSPSQAPKKHPKTTGDIHTTPGEGEEEGGKKASRENHPKHLILAVESSRCKRGRPRVQCRMQACTRSTMRSQVLNAGFHAYNVRRAKPYVQHSRNLEHRCRTLWILHLTLNALHPTFNTLEF